MADTAFTNATQILEPAATADDAATTVTPATDTENAEESSVPAEETPETPAAESPEAVAPGTVASAEAVASVDDESQDEVWYAESEIPLSSVSWWPFVAYVVVWIAAAAFAVWQLQMLPAGTAAYETDFYTMTMLGGLALLAVGPVLLLIVWLASWIGRQGARIGLMFISALVKGALATLLGAVIWMCALLLVDYLRLGRPF